MSIVLFDFDDAGSSQQFTMGKATTNFSINPCRPTGTCLYVINNKNTLPETAYIGYADNAQHRWLTRTEVFHVFGISHAYGKQVKCAWCYPKISNRANPVFGNNAHWNYISDQNLKGRHGAEHLLIRSIRKGLMGAPVTVTNTIMRESAFDRRKKFPGLSGIIINFGNKFNWPSGNSRARTITVDLY